MWEISDLNYLIFIFHNRNGHNHNIVAHSAVCTQCVVFIKLSRRVKIIIIAQFCVFSFVTTTKLWDNLLRILNFIESFLFSLLLALSLCILSNKNHWIVLWKYSSWELVLSIVPNVCIHCFVRFLRMRLLCTQYMPFFFCRLSLDVQLLHRVHSIARRAMSHSSCFGAELSEYRVMFYAQQS